MADSPLVERRKDRVLDATLELMREEGLGINMDDVARVSGVGRRSVFRYFESRSGLLRAAIARIYSQHDYHKYEELLIPGNLDASLRAVFKAAYDIVDIAGQALWDLAREEHLGDEFAEAARERRTLRHRDVSRFVTILWRGEGGAGRPPRSLVELFLLLEGSFAFYGWKLDGGISKKEMVRTASTAMGAAIGKALETSSGAATA